MIFGKIEFTYIGNLPSKFKFKNSRHVKPLSGKNLSDELKTNHIYLTGSLNEPSEIIILKERVVFLLCISTVEVLKNTVKILELNIQKKY